MQLSSPLLDGAGSAGTTGQVLTSAGAGSIPTFQTPAVAGGGGGAFDLLSALTAAEVSVTTGTTLTGTAFGRMHVATGTTADYTIALPSPTGNAGKIIGVRIAAALTRLVTLDAGGGVLIDGQQTRILWAQEAAILLCDGTGWAKLAGKSRAMFCKLSLAVVLDSAQTVAPGTMTTVQHDAANDPTGRMADLTTFRITIRRPGAYQTTTVVSFNAGMTASRVLTRLIVNAGSDYGAEASVGSTGSFPTFASPLTFTFAANDYVVGAAYQNSGASQYLFGRSLNTLSVLEIPQW